MANLTFDDSRNYFFSANYFAPNDILQFSNQNARIRGITTINQANVAVGYYINRNAVGTPDIIVPADQLYAVPIPNASYVGVAFSPPQGGAPSGQVYVHYTTDLVVAASSNVPQSTSGPALWDSAVWDQSTWNS